MPYEKKRHYRIFMMVILLFGLGGGFFWYSGSNAEGEFISPLATDVLAEQTQTAMPATHAPTATPRQSPTIITDGTLAEQVASATATAKGTYGIAVKNLKTGETYYELQDEPFIMASTYKVPLVLASFIDEESGALPSTTKLGSFTLEKGRALVITRSEESLAGLLAQKLGWKRVQEVANSMGMTQTKYTNGFTTTPKDMMTILEKIYYGDNMSQSVRDKMYDLLVRQEINDRLPKYLPKDVTVAHKTGELGDKRHDIGIVTSDKTAYVIVLMSKDLGSPEKGKEALAKLSLVFYQYFTK